tara:strand:+ start:789 stop:1391 length:603 start_codon:yes stop_codon:yes gene_type:complete
MNLDRIGSNVNLQNPAFIHDSVQMFGKIEIGQGSSLWPNVVIRAEMFNVKVGDYTNIQDFSMIHIGASTGTVIGDHCSITHHCTIHGCKIGNNCLIGINATIMDGAVVGDNSIVAGGAFIREGTIIPENSIVMGIPGKVHSNKNNFISNRFNAFMYYYNAICYKSGNHRGWHGKEFEKAAQKEMEKIKEDFNSVYSLDDG